MADANAIYHSGLIITHQHFLYHLIITIITLIISVCFIFYFSSHISLLMADANSSFTIYYSTLLKKKKFYLFAWMMLSSHIIQVLLFITHQLISSSTHLPPLLLGDATFIFILLFYIVLLLFSLASIQLFHPMHGLFCFILCHLSRAYTFSIMFITHCKCFFSKFLHPEFGSQCCKYTLTEPPAPKMHVHTPSTANAFWGYNIED